MEYIRLNNGTNIPALGFGTWCIDDGKAAEAVRTAIELGYRHIDTAQAYGNERGVGEGVRTCGIPRKELFVVSKVAAENKRYASAAASIDETLAKMKLDYLDMMIIHSPQPWAEWRGEKRYFEENREVWRALEDACTAGKLRTIGVSNFLRDDLESLLPHCRIRPAVNQVLAHIGSTPEELIAFCRENGIAVEAYSPIAHGEALRSPEIVSTAKKYGVSPARLCIKYILQLGLVALPKASSRGHIRENAELDFTISDEDMKMLRSVNFRDYGEYSYFPVFSGKLKAAVLKTQIEFLTPPLFMNRRVSAGRFVRYAADQPRARAGIPFCPPADSCRGNVSLHLPPQGGSEAWEHPRHISARPSAAISPPPRPPPVR